MEITKIYIEKMLKDIQAARDWSVDLKYPYPESHAIWLGKEAILKELLDKLNSESPKP